jgi:rare lipoprotein A (peptidoglycan hydrolase)
MPRSTLRRALCAGALCLTATSTAAAVPAAAHAARLGVSTKRLNVRVGSHATVRGHVSQMTPGIARLVAMLQIQRGHRWLTIERARLRANGRYLLRDRRTRAASNRVRVRLSTGETRRIGRLNVYRLAQVSWYGPGLYGGHLGCGGTLSAGSLGVANKTLPCGTKVTLRHGSRVVRVPVIDRGPYVGGREYDLTAATAQRLHFSGAGAMQVTR